MKHYTFPHITFDANWTIGVVAYNSGYRAERVYLIFNCGTNVHEIAVEIQPKNRYAMTEVSLPFSSGSEFSVTILGSDYIMPTVAMFLQNPNGGFSASNFFNPIERCLPSSFVNTPLGAAQMTTKDYVEFLGQSNGSYLLPLKADILNYCLRIDRIKYYEKQKMGLGDCSTPDGSPLSGHPQGTHHNGKQFDINYPIVNGGYTQYAPPGATITPIVVQGNVTNAFDYVRFMDFCRCLRNFAPETKVNVHNIIRDFLMGKFPNDSLDWLHGDSQVEYNHDRHAHISI